MGEALPELGEKPGRCGNSKIELKFPSKMKDLRTRIGSSLKSKTCGWRALSEAANARPLVRFQQQKKGRSLSKTCAATTTTRFRVH